MLNMFSRERCGIVPMSVPLMLTLAVLQTGLFATPAQAQIMPGPGRLAIDPAEFSPTRRLPKDPLAQTAFLKAIDALKSGDVTEGLQTLQQMIDQDSDFYVSDDRSIRDSLLERIENLFRLHQEDYERQYGPTAKQMLAAANADQNFLQVEEVTRRFLLTSAGASALQELARHDCDRGEPARAARLLEQLAAHPQASNPRIVLINAVQLLVDAGDLTLATALLERHSDLFPDAGEREALVMRGAAPVAMDTTGLLYEWRMPFGSENHLSRTSIAPAFGSPAWTAPLVDDTYDFWLIEAPMVANRLGEDTRHLLEATEQQIRANTSRISMPAASPLIIGDLVIAAGPGSIKAFDLSSGELVWNGLITDETFDYLSKWSFSAGDAQDAVREDMRNLFTAVRGWRDLTSNSISSDGQRIYAVTGCQLVGTTSPQRMMQNSQRHPLLPQRSNRLIAYDLATEGKIVWAIGSQAGSTGTAELVEHREIFFLGAPLPVDGHLYVLGEERGQVQVFELDPATGSILWSIGLLNPDRDLVIDESRRLSGLMPAYRDGLLICPSGEGTLTAIDPRKRHVIWTHFYNALPNTLQNQAFMMRVVRPQNQAANQSRDELISDQRWFDSRVMIAGPYVVFTPPDSENLVCINLSDGTPIAPDRIERGQNLYAATIYKDQLILVGRSEISSMSLSGEQTIWKKPIPIPAPSGRGIRMGEQFLQPLITGEIAVIDLPTGRLLTRLPIETAMAPGNLTAAKGRLVIQSATGVSASQSLEQLQLEIASRLKSNPGDAESLARRGALELQQGQTESGVADLKLSLATSAPALAQSALVWSLLDGLRTDFASYRSQAEQLEPKLQGNEQRLQFLKIFANGLQNSGEYAAAFRDQLKILTLLTWPEIPQDVSGQWRVTDSCWSMGCLQSILANVDDATRKQLLGEFNAWAATTSPDLLMRLLPLLPEDWIETPLLVEKLSAASGISVTPEPQENARRNGLRVLTHERESLLRSLLKSSNAQIQMQAAAQLLQIARAAEDTSMIQQMLGILEKTPMESSGNSKPSTADIIADAKADAKVQEQLNATIKWTMPVHVGEQAGGAVRSSLTQIPRLGPPSDALRGWSFFLDQAGGHIEIFDPQGRHCTRISAGYPGVRYAVVDTELARYVIEHHHLAAVVLLDRFILLDFLTDPSSPQLIVNRSLVDDGDPLFTGRAPFSGMPRVGLRTPLIEIRPGKLGGNVGMLADSRLCYTVGNELVAINPMNGNELWRRRDIELGSEVLSDREFVVVKPPEQSNVRVYRAVDGEFLSSHPLPVGTLNSVDRGGGDWGRYVPGVETGRDQLEFKLHDPALQKVVWEHRAPAGTKWAVVEGRDIAFVSPDHQMTVMNGLSGEMVFQTTIPAPEKLEQFTLLRDPENWVLLTNGRAVDPIRRQPYGNRLQDLVQAEVSGECYGISGHDGRVLWSKKLNGPNVMTQLPPEWPILYFARGRGRMETLILNRRTGEEIRRGSANDDGTGVSWVTETKPLRLNLRAGQDRVTLYFGEAPPTQRRPTLPEQSEPPGR